MDILDIAVLLRDSNRSLRHLYPDYEEKSEPCRDVLRRIMQDSGKGVLPALTYALQAVVDNNLSDTHYIQIQSLWLTAAATDLLMEHEAEAAADKVKKLIAGLDLPNKTKRK